MTSTKLDINSEYLVYTTYETISALKLKIVGILSYEQALELPYSVKVLALNEKVVDTNDNTEEYLKDLLFYKCTRTNSKNEEEIYVIWDDIIDFNKTTKLSVSYEYRLTLDISSDLISDKSTIENSITTFIANNYGNTVKSELIAYGTTDSTEDETTKQLNYYKELFESAKALADKMAKLKQIESLINYFAKDDMQEKIKTFNESLTSIQDDIAAISAIIH